MKVWLDGKLVDKAEAALTVFDHGTLYGDGVFEGIRSYGGKIFQCKAHMDRLYRSAELIHMEIPYSCEELVEASYEAMAANGLTDCYIRTVVTRGAGSLGTSPMTCPRPCVFIIADQIALYPEEMYTDGMPVIICKTVRISPKMLSPEIKSLNYLNNILAKMEGAAAGVSEVLMTNVDGNICEASTDNIFIVKDGRLITPPREAGILLGITRSVAMHIAKRDGIEVVEENIRPEDVYSADECFLSGTAAEIIPVNSVGDKQIGQGNVGPVTAGIMKAFHEFVKTDEQIEYAGL